MAGFNHRTVTLPDGHSLLDETVTLAMDIGGTLAKLVYVHREKQAKLKNRERSDDDVLQLHMMTFDGDNIDEMLNYIQAHVLDPLTPGSPSQAPGTFQGGPRPESGGHRRPRARATGVGSYRHHDRLDAALEGRLDLTVDAKEFEHCVRGLDITWRLLGRDELLYVDRSDVDELQFQTRLTSGGCLPCILVCMGSSLTILQVNEEGKVDGFVGASCLGGMTFLGLGRLLTNAKSYDELSELAGRGSREAVDLTVSDVAGGQYNGVPAQLVVSSFGKLSRLDHVDATELRVADMASSLLYCVAEQLAMTVSIVSKAQRVRYAVFCGSFLANNDQLVNHVRQRIATSSAFLGTFGWSGPTVRRLYKQLRSD